MKISNNIIRIFLKMAISLPKTLIFNLVVFPFNIAIKLPVLISVNVNIQGIYKGCIEIDSKKISTAMIKIGFGGSNAINSERGILFLNKCGNSKLIFKGKAKFSEGIKIFNNSGITIFGENFSTNKNCFIASDKKIIFGKNVLLGWNISIRDSDGHTVIENGVEKENKKEVIIGNNVWVCSNVNILKGTLIGNNCIISYGSLVVGLRGLDNLLIGGYPAKILKENIDWKK